MLNITRIALLNILLFILPGCGADEIEDGNSDEVKFSILHDNQYNVYANTTAKSVMVITNQSDYESELLKRSTETALEFDFTRSVILMIDMGPRPSGGYSVSLQGIDNLESHLMANIVYSIPGADCVTTQAITNPYEFIAINRTTDILVTETREMKSCE